MSTETTLRTEWHDAARIARDLQMKVRAVRWHWRQARNNNILDLPHDWSEIDAQRAAELRDYIKSRRYTCRRSRTSTRRELVNLD